VTKKVSGDEESVASDGSRITETEETTTILDMPSTMCTSTRAVTPPKKKRAKRKPTDDCHVIICWSQLSKLVKENMVCSGCGNPICQLHRRTIGIATELDFACKFRETYTAYTN
jgi:hypothetical protein